MLSDLHSGNPDLKLQYYKARFQKAQSDCITWWSLLEKCYHYTVPSRNLFWTSNQTQGAQKNAYVYDTTGVIALRNFVSKMQMGITPPQQVWCNIVPSEELPDSEQKEAFKLECEQLTKDIFKYIKRSNFDMAINECYYDLAICNGALMIMEQDDDDNPLLFQSIPANQLVVEASLLSQRNSCYRVYENVRISDIKALWPKATLTPNMELMYKNDANAQAQLVEGVVYVQDSKKPWRCILWSDDNLLMEEEEYSSPWVIFRWSKINNETFGRGPVMDAIPSILSLNELARIELASANWNAFKPMMAFSDSVFSPFNFRLQPMTVIPVARTADGSWPIQPLPDAANPAFQQVTSNDLRAQINAIMYANPLGSINETPVRTATELALRTRNLSEEIGPVGPRLQAELIRPIMQRIIYILKRRGLITPIEVNGRELDLEYQSPLVIAQGQLNVQSFLQYVQALQGIIGPEKAQLYINPVEAPFWMSDQLGIPAEVMSSRAKVEEALGLRVTAMSAMEVASLGAPAGVPGQALPAFAG